MQLIKYEYPHAEEMDHWMDHFLNQAFSRFGGWPVPQDRAHMLRIDILEDTGHYCIRAEVPGVPKEDLRVEIEDSILTISGQREKIQGEETNALSFKRTLTLPAYVDTGATSAKLENGVLLVTIPKQAKNKPQTIAIQ